MPSRLLYLGCQPGHDVMDLQDALNALTAAPDQSTACPLLTVDGIFGHKTASRVREFQQKNGLAADAIVGGETWAMLIGLLEGVAGLQIHRPVGGSGPGPAKGMNGAAVHGKADPSSSSAGAGAKGGSGKGAGAKSGDHHGGGKDAGYPPPDKATPAGAGKAAAGAGFGMHGAAKVWSQQAGGSGKAGNSAGKGSADGGGAGKSMDGGSKGAAAQSGSRAWAPWAGAMGATKDWAPAYKGYYKSASATSSGKGGDNDSGGGKGKKA